MLSWGACVRDGVATLDCIPIVFQNIIFAALIFAGIVALFLIIHAGFKFVLSSGDPKKVENARNTIVYAIMGLIIVLFAFLILNLVSFITGVNCIRFLFGCGTSPSAPPPPLTCDNPSAQFTVFITSSSYDSASFGGSTGTADTICQDHAINAGLPGRYTAWVAIGPSDEPKDRGMASCATAGAKSASWSLVDGKRVADHWADLTDGNIQAAIRMDELGNLVGAGHVNTGINETGNAYPIIYTCKQWTHNIADCAGGGECTCPAFSDGTDARWTWNSPCFWDCGNPAARLYCFQYAP